MIEFVLNEEVVKTEMNEGVTLLDFIREHRSLKGTKIGCREGDCGACTVLVGELTEGELSYQNITSCISPLGNAQGKHIVTIEGINLSKKLNVAQQAMADNNATQCGFCTPGFVVSMTGFALNERNHDLNGCVDALSGNICRCTGYKSIEKAAKSVEQHIKNVGGQERLNWLVKESFIPEYFLGIPKLLKSLTKKDLNRKGQLVANGTDLFVHNADRLAEEDIQLIALDDSLRYIKHENNKYEIGVNTTVSDLLKNKDFNIALPALSSQLKLVSSEPIRNMGTLGGNFVNASPIGDMSIFFLALNSTLSIVGNDGVVREIEFNKFHQEYKKYDLQKGEVLQSISFECNPKKSFVNFEKVSKRTHLDIASVNGAANIQLKDDVVVEAHFSVGGVAAVPKYLFLTSKFIAGKQIHEVTIQEALSIMQSEISPISDVRGSSEYKRLLARQLFIAHFIKLSPEKSSTLKSLLK